jgi:glycerol-3-phosphate dehydrogenase
MSEVTCDVVIIGGGINGAAVARDAAGRGLRVFLAERDDYGGATSSASSKLIHGGIRYLEQGHVRLVRESLRERAVILTIAPHLTRPLRFVLPVTRSQPRPAWMVNIGLRVYDLLAGSARVAPVGSLPRSRWNEASELKQCDMRALLHYPDVLVDDSRLVLETLLDARARRATIRSRATVEEITPRQDGYSVAVRQNGNVETIATRIVVNAAGPWADKFVPKTTGGPRLGLKLVRGSHLVIHAPPNAPDHAYTLQNHDGRVIFVLPWLAGLRVIGTTDAVHDTSPDAVRCDQIERAYMIDAYNRAFRTPIGLRDIVWEWSGVRPLFDDGETSASKVSRESTIDVRRNGSGALVSLLGGKLTTHRKLAEEVFDELAPLFGRLAGRWTHSAPLHGGELSVEALDALGQQSPADLDRRLMRRWTRTYGSNTHILVDRVISAGGMHGSKVGGVFEAELRYSADVEDTRTAFDFLSRRTKLFFGLKRCDQYAIAEWFGSPREELATLSHA